MINLPKTVIFLGFVSFLTDLSNEMIYPLLPIFLSTVLGAGAIALGIIEGIAESTAALLKAVSGIWADRLRRRKPFVIAGYGLSGIVRPLIGLAALWTFVLAIRVLDRIGKGLRTSPRDALIADVTESSQRGTAYGFHRAMDHAGAVVGPLIAAGLLGFGSISIRHVFLLSGIPACAVMVVLIACISEPRINGVRHPNPSTLKLHWHDVGRDYKVFLLSILVFTLGNSTDAFLLLRLKDAGVFVSGVAMLWSVHHLVKMFSTYVGGRLSDRIGRRRMILFEWLVYAVIYLAFAMVGSPTMLIILFVAYGLYFGFTEPSERAWVADLVPEQLRGTAFGYYHGVISFGALPASIIFGFLWQIYGVDAAFLTGAGLAAGASAILFMIRHTGAVQALNQTTQKVEGFSKQDGLKGNSEKDHP